MKPTTRALATAALLAGSSFAVALADEPAPAAAPTTAEAAPTAAKAAPAAAKAAAPAPEAPAGAAPAADATEAARRAQVLAKFEGGQVTVGDMEEAIEEQSPFMRRRYGKEDNKKAMLDKLVRFALLAQEAEKRGYGDDPVVRQAVKQNAVQRLMKTEFDDKITAQSIPAEDVKKYYDDNIGEFMRPATRRASHVLVATEEEAKALITEASGLDMRAFRQLARDKSLDEETKLRGGDLRYLDADGKLQGEDVARLPKALASAIFALKNVGDVAKKPIKMPGGYSVVKLTGMRPANERSLADAEETIRARLWRERRQTAIDAFVTNLRAELKPEVKPELVSLIKFDPPKDVPKAANVPRGFPADRAHENVEH